MLVFKSKKATSVFEKIRREYMAYAAVKTIRKGQAIFNACFNLFPFQTNDLRGTKVDCFYNDDLIEDFLIALYDKLESKSFWKIK